MRGYYWNVRFDCGHWGFSSRVVCGFENTVFAQTIASFFRGMICEPLKSFLDLDLPPEVRRAIATIRRR